MAGKQLFISYRLEDTKGWVGRLYDRLKQKYGAKKVFRDIDNIPLSEDFREHIEQSLKNTDIVIALIGRKWLELLKDRASQPNDVLRVELETAHKFGAKIMPVLVDNAVMPKEADLPPSLQATKLSYLNAARLRDDPDFEGDMRKLITGIEDLRAKAKEKQEQQRAAEEARRQAESEAKRKAEDEARRNAEQEAERRKEHERLGAISALSSEDIAKAEELAHWEYIKTSEKEQVFRDHLKRFPQGVTVKMARTSLEQLVWHSIGEQPDERALIAYLEEFPTGEHAEEAKAKRERIIAKAEQERAEAERNAARQAEVERRAAEIKGDIESKLEHDPFHQWRLAARQHGHKSYEVKRPLPTSCEVKKPLFERMEFECKWCGWVYFLGWIPVGIIYQVIRDAFDFDLRKLDKDFAGYLILVGLLIYILVGIFMLVYVRLDVYSRDQNLRQKGTLIAVPLVIAIGLFFLGFFNILLH